MKSKKVLIITYYWPPCGGIGVLRCLKFAKYLKKLGWDPIIYTAKNAHYPSIDPSNFKDIDPEIEILRGKIWEPYTIFKKITGRKSDENVNNIFYTSETKKDWKYKLSVWIRSNFFIPDARSAWIRPSVKYLKQYLVENPVDAILSNGPPHTNTRIATILKKETGIPFFADFQDPWTQVDYYQLLSLSSYAKKKHEKLEKEVFQYADYISIVSKTWKQDLKSIGAQNVAVLPWGYDEDDYKNLKHQSYDKFIISHFGILGYDRSPDTLIDVLENLCSLDKGFKDRLDFRLAGQIDRAIKSKLENSYIKDCVSLIGNISRDKALVEMKNSHMLLLLMNKQANAKGRIPGKLFEYMRVKRPILALSEIIGDASDIVIDTYCGYATTYLDEDGQKLAITKEYNRFINKDFRDIDSQIDKYSIENITKDLANLLDHIIKE